MPQDNDIHIINFRVPQYAFFDHGDNRYVLDDYVENNYIEGN